MACTSSTTRNDPACGNHDDWRREFVYAPGTQGHRLSNTHTSRTCVRLTTGRRSRLYAHTEFFPACHTSSLVTGGCPAGVAETHAALAMVDVRITRFATPRDQFRGHLSAVLRWRRTRSCAATSILVNVQRGSYGIANGPRFGRTLAHYARPSRLAHERTSCPRRIYSRTPSTRHPRRASQSLHRRPCRHHGP